MWGEYDYRTSSTPDPEQDARIRAAYGDGQSAAYFRGDFSHLAPAGEPTHDEVLYQMERMGGSFVSRLAKAWRCADSGNMLKLHAAFGDIYDTYKRMASTAPGRVLYARRSAR